MRNEKTPMVKIGVVIIIFSPLHHYFPSPLEGEGLGVRGLW